MSKDKGIKEKKKAPDPTAKKGTIRLPGW